MPRSASASTLPPIRTSSAPSWSRNSGGIGGEPSAVAEPLAQGLGEVDPPIAVEPDAGGSTHLDWPLIVGFTAAAVAGSLVGGRLASRVTPAHLTRAFALLLVAVALYTAARSVPALV